MAIASPMKVGVVGTGEMGRPLIARIHAAGHHVTAFARRPETLKDLEVCGIETVSALVALGTDCDFVIVYVLTDEQVRAVVLDSGLLTAMPRGSTLVIHTTTSPATVQAVAVQAARHGVAVVDAPGSGGPAQAAEGTLTLFAGGEIETVDRCRTLFAEYATNVVRFGPVGAGQAMKLINNLLFAGHVQLAIEADRLAAEFSIDAPTMFDALRNCSGASTATGLVVAKGSVKALLEAGGPFIYKDALLTRDVATDLGLPLGSFGPVIRDVLASVEPYRAAASGHDPASIPNVSPAAIQGQS